MSQLLQDIKTTNTHIPKKIIREVYGIDANPRYGTLALYVQYNYPQYNNDHDLTILWDHAHSSDGIILSLIQNI